MSLWKSVCDIMGWKYVPRTIYETDKQAVERKLRELEQRVKLLEQEASVYAREPSRQ